MSKAEDVLKGAQAQTENERAALAKRIAELQAELSKHDADKADIDSALEKVKGKS